ncbi:hypothetical protein HDU84_005469 [Entophlyctis sp. JEL0112]|nr:hypothetical protein HDU84_005469 [Entophlyctis sp. JEL0112]
MWPQDLKKHCLRQNHNFIDDRSSQPGPQTLVVDAETGHQLIREGPRLTGGTRKPGRNAKIRFPTVSGLPLKVGTLPSSSGPRPFFSARPVPANTTLQSYTKSRLYEPPKSAFDQAPRAAQQSPNVAADALMSLQSSSHAGALFYPRGAPRYTQLHNTSHVSNMLHQPRFSAHYHIRDRSALYNHDHPVIPSHHHGLAAPVQAMAAPKISSPVVTGPGESPSVAAIAIASAMSSAAPAIYAALSPMAMPSSRRWGGGGVTSVSALLNSQPATPMAPPPNAPAAAFSNSRWMQQPKSERLAVAASSAATQAVHDDYLDAFEGQPAGERGFDEIVASYGDIWIPDEFGKSARPGDLF